MRANLLMEILRERVGKHWQSEKTPFDDRVRAREMSAFGDKKGMVRGFSAWQMEFEHLGVLICGLNCCHFVELLGFFDMLIEKSFESQLALL
jgi:hypothetical protein